MDVSGILCQHGVGRGTTLALTFICLWSDLEKFHVVQHLVWFHDTPNEQKRLNNAPDRRGLRRTIRDTCMRYSLAVHSMIKFFVLDGLSD